MEPAILILISLIALTLHASEPMRIVKAIGGRLVKAIDLVKSGVDPHSYEPTPGELIADGLGQGVASTYDGIMRHNISVIVDDLK